MSGRSTIWRWVVVAFVLINVGGFVYAARMGEVPHAGLHAGLALVGALLWWWLSIRDAGPRADVRDAPNLAAAAGLDDRLTHIERSVDAVAIEVERVGEGQRFVSKLFTERAAEAAAVDADIRQREIERPREPR